MCCIGYSNAAKIGDEIDCRNQCLSELQTCQQGCSTDDCKNECINNAIICTDKCSIIPIPPKPDPMKCIQSCNVMYPTQTCTECKGNPQDISYQLCMQVRNMCENMNQMMINSRNICYSGCYRSSVKSANK